MSSRDDLRALAVDHRLQVAIDGPAGAGKSSVGRAIADALGCRYLDTGLLYRAVTWLALRSNLSAAEPEQLTDLARSLRFSLSESGDLLVNGTSPGPELRSPHVDRAVSPVSAVPGVRSALLPWQRELGTDGCLVMVGRDIGSVVLPGAHVKLWLTASPEERARRRGRETQPGSRDRAVVAAELRARDQTDSHRAVAPSVPARDAVVLNTDGLAEREVVVRALDEIELALRRRGAQFLPTDSP